MFGFHKTPEIYKPSKDRVKKKKVYRYAGLEKVIDKKIYECNRIIVDHTLEKKFTEQDHKKACSDKVRFEKIKNYLHERAKR